jgi:hypothetical protein
LFATNLKRAVRSVVTADGAAVILVTGAWSGCQSTPGSDRAAFGTSANPAAVGGQRNTDVASLESSAIAATNAIREPSGDHATALPESPVRAAAVAGTIVVSGVPVEETTRRSPGPYATAILDPSGDHAPFRYA